jgi:hypothetical protein
MGFHENLSEFKGKPVEDWTSGSIDAGKLASVCVRLRTDWDSESPLTEQLSELLELSGTDRIESLVIGAWHGDDTGATPEEIVEALIAARDRLPNLKHLFFGDITSEENEVSWIQLMDFSALLLGYPKLTHLTVRGSEHLTFGTLAHANLRELVIQTGGLNPSVVHEVAASKLPALEHLELWLGTPNYGGDSTIEDLAPFLSGTLFPKLKYLGLKNSEIQDEIAGVMAGAPVLKMLDVLDLSEGTLGDEGARALLKSADVRRLKKLDLHYHFISEAVQKEFATLGIEVDLSNPQEPEEWSGQETRFISVSE